MHGRSSSQPDSWYGKCPVSVLAVSSNRFIKLGTIEEALDLALVVKSGDEGCTFSLQQVAPEDREWVFDQVCGMFVRLAAIRAEKQQAANQELEAML